MEKLKVSKTASKGIAIDKIYKYEKTVLTADDYDVQNIYSEKEIFQKAVGEVSSDLEKLAKDSEVFEAHMQLVQDPMLIDGVTEKISDCKNAQMALKDTIDEFVMIFESMDDPYMRGRADDVKDIFQRLLSKMQNAVLKDLSQINTPTIVIAKDLAPSDTATMNFEHITGFATELGGVTSHVSIMARNMNLPVLVGVHGLFGKVKDGDFVIIDAGNGDLIINPDDETVKKYEQIKKNFEEKELRLKEDAHLEPVTQDGKRVLVYANVGNVEDAQKAVKAHIDGIGLFRSEFLYMESDHFPTQDEQFEAYKNVVLTCKGEVIIRTLDIGGDKGLSYYEFDKEENPFLGYRAIRLSLSMEDMFKTQLKALLRASSYGTLSIMYPMIISIEELLKANALLEECKKELDKEGIPYSKDVKVGMMMETPAGVIEADNFAKYVDFFSIGTNDLTQYILAVDRGNEKISDMYNSFHPAVLHSIQKIIDAGHKENITVGMCGEFASDERACKMLLGMGLDEFSVAHTQVSAIKSIIRRSNFEQCKKVSEKIRTAYSLADVEKILKEYK